MNVFRQSTPCNYYTVRLLGLPNVFLKSMLHINLQVNSRKPRNAWSCILTPSGRRYQPKKQNPSSGLDCEFSSCGSTKTTCRRLFLSLDMGKQKYFRRGCRAIVMSRALELKSKQTGPVPSHKLQATLCRISQCRCRLPIGIPPSFLPSQVAWECLCVKAQRDELENRNFHI